MLIYFGEILFEQNCFNTIISHQLFDYKITFVNSQHEKEIQKVILYSKTGFEMFV